MVSRLIPTLEDDDPDTFNRRAHTSPVCLHTSPTGLMYRFQSAEYTLDTFGYGVQLDFMVCRIAFKGIQFSLQPVVFRFHCRNFTAAVCKFLLESVVFFPDRIEHGDQ